MLDSEKQKKFIELRASGLSYIKIAKKLNISKPTLIKWSREFSNEINNAKALELESLKEQYLLARSQRLRLLGIQLSKLTEEMMNRDLSEIPTWRLFDMHRKVIAEIAKDDETIEFALDIERTANILKDLNRKTVKWYG